MSYPVAYAVSGCFVLYRWAIGSVVIAWRSDPIWKATPADGHLHADCEANRTELISGLGWYVRISAGLALRSR